MLEKHILPYLIRQIAISLRRSFNFGFHAMNVPQNPVICQSSQTVPLPKNLLTRPTPGDTRHAEMKDGSLKLLVKIKQIADSAFRSAVGLE